MLKEAYRPDIGREATSQDVSWDANILNVSHPANVVAGSDISIIVDFENSTPWHYNEFSKDSCYTINLIQTGVNIGIAAYIDGEEVGDSGGECENKDAAATREVDANVPADIEGTHQLEVEIYGADTGEVVETYSSTVNVISDDPEFNIVTVSPQIANAKPGSTVTLEGQYEVESDDTESANVELYLSGEKVHEEVLDIEPDGTTTHEIELTAPSQNGRYGYTLRLAEESSFSGEVVVEGDDGGGGGGGGTNCDGVMSWFTDSACCPLDPGVGNIPVVNVPLPNLCVLAGISVPVAIALASGVIPMPADFAPLLLDRAIDTLISAVQSDMFKSTAILVLLFTAF